MVAVSLLVGSKVAVAVSATANTSLLVGSPAALATEIGVLLGGSKVGIVTAVLSACLKGQ